MLLRKIRQFSEWLFGKWNEGHDAPSRLLEEPVLFANMHPEATRGQWIRFAGALAAEAYKEGWIRGYEHVERGGLRLEMDPDLVADHLDPSWRQSPPVNLEYDEMDVVTAPTEDWDPEELLRR